MTEVELNRSSHLIDPSLQIWGWEIPVYLFLGGVTAGIMILSALLAGRSDDGSPLSRWARLLPFAPPVLLSVGMAALFFDLEFKTHVLRFYGAFRWSSPMSWGSWILIAIYPATVMLGLATLDAAQYKKFRGALPFKGLVGWARDLAVGHERFWRGASIVLGIGLGSYTGLLLGTLGARHVWNSSVLGPLFLVSGVSTGAALMMLFPLARGERHFLSRLDMGAIALELALLAVYLIGLITGTAASQAAAGMFLGGTFTATFWSLVVIGGLLVPLLIEIIEHVKSLRPTVAAPIMLLVGGLSLRWILVLAGQL